MSHKIVFSIVALALTTNINAGWFDDTFGDSDKNQKKIEAIKDTVKNGNTAADLKKALSNEDIVAGLKEALNKGASYAVDSLGETGGFLKNGDVKIPMPKNLKKVESLLRKAGKDKYADKFVVAMNRAAESAVPLTLGIIKQGVAEMSINDAKNILQGPDDAATQYLKKSGSDKLRVQISPIVKEATSKTGVTRTYKKMIGKLGFAGKYMNLEDYDIDKYVTEKTMDGLFTMIAQEEKKIRDNPGERTTDILKSVFGYD